MPQGKYWNLAGQTVAIVASILLAFSIQAWWEDLQEKEAADRLLLSFLEEYEANIEYIGKSIEYWSLVENAALKLFQAATQPEQIEPSEVDTLIGTLTWAHSPPVTWGALDSLVIGGRLELIENADLRRRLAALYQSKEIIRRDADHEIRFMFEDFFPFLRKNGFLPQIANMETARVFPIFNVQYDGEVIALNDNMDHRELLKNREFLGLLTMKRMMQLDSITEIEQIFEEREILIELVRQETR